jgi:hypothetical protein
LSTIEERAHPVRSGWLQALALTVLFLGGGVAGSGIAQRLAPDSIVAAFVGLFTFAVPFVVGLHLWLGLAIGIALWRLARHGRRGLSDTPSPVPPGSAVFVPVCTLLVGGAGLLVGVFGSSLGVVTTVGLYLLLGLGYGTVCWLCARSGYLPFPE